MATPGGGKEASPGIPDACATGTVLICIYCTMVLVLTMVGTYGLWGIHACASSSVRANRCMGRSSERGRSLTEVDSPVSRVPRNTGKSVGREAREPGSTAGGKLSRRGTRRGTGGGVGVPWDVR